MIAANLAEVRAARASSSLPPPSTELQPPPPPPPPSTAPPPQPSTRAENTTAGDLDANHLRAGGDFHAGVHRNYPLANNSDGMGGMDKDAWAAKLVHDNERAAERMNVKFTPGTTGKGGAGSALITHGSERAAERMNLKFTPGTTGKGGAGSALITHGFQKSATELDLDYVPGTTGKGGAGSALTTHRFEKRATELGLDYAPGKSGRGGARSAVQLAASAAKLPEPPKSHDPRDISDAKAQRNCAELNKHGPGGWSYTLYPQNKPDYSHLWRIMYSNRNLRVFQASLKQAKGIVQANAQRER